MTFKLKTYQANALAALDAFLSLARGAQDEAAMTRAFNEARAQALGESAPRMPYRESTALPGVPQVCIRIPTGGGKTLLAAHAVQHAARLYVGRPSAPLALWLVPTNTIREQTLQALKAPDHPYRKALLAHYPAERLVVIDIADCEQLRAHDLSGTAVVVVGTLQTLRVENTTGREVYAYKEAFEPHFATLPEADFFERVGERDLEAQPYLSRADLGKVKRSFANLLAWHRPIVIVDEAHNARSDLSFEVLRRIRPACVIEWTATPAREQNVLYHVSAQELKAEDMVKLPIVLSPHPRWEEAVRDAVLTRETLATEALGEADYVRPIVLFQADAKGGDVPLDVLLSHLTDTLHIARARIAVATGNQRELDGVNLFDRTCPVDFVITVEALKEGWDCSFAYVFCTVQNVRSAKDMEQLLGRVLRMPYATRRRSEKLNRAYAHVCATATAQVASQLGDRLVDMGFEQMEVAQYLQPDLDGDLFAECRAEPEQVESCAELPAAAVAAVVAQLPQAATASTGQAGESLLNLRGVLAPEAIERAVAAAPKKERAVVAAVLERHQARALTAAAPSERGETFAPLPQLLLPVQGDLLLMESSLLDESLDWSLTGLPADLPGFQREDDAHPFLIDVERGRLRIREDEGQYELDIDRAQDGVRREDIIRALEGRMRRDPILQPDMVTWLGRVLDGLQARGFELTHIARHLNRVAEACARRLESLLAAQTRQAFQQTLLGPPQQRPTLADGHDFRFDPAQYPARWLYNGRHGFSRHFYPLPGELKPETDAEETDCAIQLDRMSQVKWWVRNLERQPMAAFWLPTSTDRFYPDFVAQLHDGRLFVVEYKGGDRWSNDDSKEKRDIGAVWAAASGGRCVFLMATDAKTAGKSVPAQLREALG